MPSSSGEERWNMPEDELSWSGNAAASDASAAKHVQQTKKSWVLDSPPRSIDTGKRSSSGRRRTLSPYRNKKEAPPVNPLPASRLAPFNKPPTSSRTPSTLMSTPDTASNTRVTPARKDEPLPESYVTMIANSFGSKADLYNDVLGISRFASPRAVRIAYFKRGREVLSERTQNVSHGKTSATVGGQINEVARLRFQAVSMAYEIVSNAAWLDAYDRCMLVTEDSDDQDEDDYDDERAIDEVLSNPDISSTRSLASTSALRRTNSAGSLRSRAKSHTGVRWNEEVEELVFNQDPAERIKKKKKKSKKKKTKRIAVDEGVDLAKHLQQLDKEAENNFVHDVLDDLEQSIDQLFSFGGDDEQHEEDSDDHKEEVEPRQLFPEIDTEPLREELSTPKQPKKKRQVPNAPKKKKSSPSRKQLETSDIDYEFEVYKNHSRRSSRAASKPSKSTNPFDDDAPVESVSRQEVEASHTPKGKQARAPTVGHLMFASPNGERTRMSVPQAPPSPKSPKGSPKRRNRTRSKEKKKAFQAPDDIAVTKKYDHSIDDGEHTVDDSVSTLSASVVQRHINRDLTNSRYKEGIKMDKAEQERERLKQEGRGNNTNTAAVTFDPITTDTTDEYFEVAPQNTSIEVDGNDVFCLQMCGGELAETARAAGIAQGDGDDPSFTAFLMVYLNAMASDLARLGHSIRESLPGFDFFMVPDNELDGMLSILETELEEVPVDELAGSFSRELLPSIGTNDEAAETSC